MMSTYKFTRRGFIGAGMALAAGAAGVVSQQRPAHAKSSKQQVAYQGQPSGEKMCGNCRHFVASDNSCKLVDGDISPNAYCRLWSKK